MINGPFVVINIHTTTMTTNKHSVIVHRSSSSSSNNNNNNDSSDNNDRSDGLYCSESPSTSVSPPPLPPSSSSSSSLETRRLGTTRQKHRGGGRRRLPPLRCHHHQILMQRLWLRNTGRRRHSSSSSSSVITMLRLLVFASILVLSNMFRRHHRTTTPTTTTTLFQVLPNIYSEEKNDGVNNNNNNNNVNSDNDNDNDNDNYNYNYTTKYLNNGNTKTSTSTDRKQQKQHQQLPSFLEPYRPTIEVSHLVQFDHCDFPDFPPSVAVGVGLPTTTEEEEEEDDDEDDEDDNNNNNNNWWKEFLEWSEPVLQKLKDDNDDDPGRKCSSSMDKLQKQQQQQQQKQKQKQQLLDYDCDNSNDNHDDVVVAKEIRMELLQLYATHKGWCDYSSSTTIGGRTFRFSSFLNKSMTMMTMYTNITDDQSVSTSSSSSARAAERTAAMIATSSSLRIAREKLMKHALSLLSNKEDEDDGTSRSVVSSSSNHHHRHYHVPKDQARVVFVIVAFTDVDQLAALVDAILLPQHFVIIHLETNTPRSFVDHVYEKILWKYDADNHHNKTNSSTTNYYNNNIAIVQFGSIVYTTDSVSHINLQIMDWIVNDLEIQFDFLSLLDGKSFPLWGAPELARHLHKSNGHVWLGEMTQNGRRVNTTSQSRLLVQKSLYSSPASSPNQKFEIHAKKLYNNTANIPPSLTEAMRYKTNSGNQGVYSYETVTKLLSNGQVKLLFYLAQHGCCCCIEERSWIAAMDLIGLRHDAMTNYANYQLWGGRTMNPDGSCPIRMSNEVLIVDPNICYRSENVGTDDNFTFTGDRLWSSLVRAKHDKGFLFARKFDSRNPKSVELRDRIIRELHDEWAHDLKIE